MRPSVCGEAVLGSLCAPPHLLLKQPYRAAAVIHACFADVETELEGEKYLLRLVHTTGYSPPHPSAGQRAPESHLIPVGPVRYHQVYLALTSRQTGGTW